MKKKNYVIWILIAFFTVFVVLAYLLVLPPTGNWSNINLITDGNNATYGHYACSQRISNLTFDYAIPYDATQIKIDLLYDIHGAQLTSYYYNIQRREWVSFASESSQGITAQHIILNAQDVIDYKHTLFIMHIAYGDNNCWINFYEQKVET